MVKSKKIINYLCAANPDAMLRRSEKKVILAFRRAAKRVPAYRKLIASLKINPSRIRDIKSFHKLVPFLDKFKFCQGPQIHEFCLDGRLDGIRSVLTSSGHGGTFSFGVSTARDMKNAAYLTDLLLDHILNTSSKKSMLINCLPMGVKVFTSLPLAETSVRQEMVWAVIKQFRSHFYQMILVSDPTFFKKVIEEGTEQGIDWKKGIFHFIVGGEGIAENYRSYIAHLTGIDFNDPSKGVLGASMGVAELGLNIFHETKDTILIRRLAHSNPELSQELFGKNIKACPMLFVYYPQRSYVEEVAAGLDKNEIAISMLNLKLKIPLIRYKTGDLGKIIPFHKIKEILSRFGYPQLVPELKLPLIAIYGRNQAIEFAGRAVYPEEVKEALYADFSLASSITGAFKLAKDAEGITLSVQLKKDVELSQPLQDKLKAALEVFTSAPMNIIYYPYYSFPYFMDLDYERKFNYI